MNRKLSFKMHARNSGEHTPLACWFWRLVETVFEKFAIARTRSPHAGRMRSPDCGSAAGLMIRYSLVLGIWNLLL
jgi:hypothetical protein